MIGHLIRLLVFGALIYVAYRLFVSLFPRRPRFKCATCRHCARLDADGVMCRFGDKETFKNPIHIENCIDFVDDPRISGRR